MQAIHGFLPENSRFARCPTKFLYRAVSVFCVLLLFCRSVTVGGYPRSLLSAQNSLSTSVVVWRPLEQSNVSLFGMSTTFTNTHTHWQQSNCGNRRIWFWSRSGSTNQLEDSGGWHRKIRAKNKAHTHRPSPQRTLIEIELLCSLFLFFRLQILLAKLSHGRHGCFVCLMHEFCCNGFGGSPNLPFGYVYKLAVDDRLFVSSQ